MIHTSRKINDYKPQWVINKIKLAVIDFLKSNPNKSIKDITIACFGLAFKPNINDLRGSPALNIANKLIEFNFGKLLAVEPNVDKLPSDLKNFFDLTSANDAIKNANICVLLVDHDEFKSIDRERLKNITIIDTKGIWDNRHSGK